MMRTKFWLIFFFLASPNTLVLPPLRYLLAVVQSLFFLYLRSPTAEAEYWSSARSEASLKNASFRKPKVTRECRGWGEIAKRRPPHTAAVEAFEPSRQAVVFLYPTLRANLSTTPSRGNMNQAYRLVPRKELRVSFSRCLVCFKNPNGLLSHAAVFPAAAFQALP